ncbi:MAG: polysaccharide biosynthesis tyrosine autokinase [Lachnospiraceae bacterium]|nr:polysaccharide biosynthesis tyrosine autokinase [Lachnospiraceae bacterium]
MNEWIEYLDNNRAVIHLDGLFKLLLRHIAVIILSTILLAGAGFVYSAYFIEPLYQSSIKMYVNNSVNASTSTNITTSDITASQYLVETYAVVLTSYPTLSEVIEQTGVSYTYEQLSSMISTSAIDDTEVFRVTVTSTDPVEAAEIANAIAEIAPDEIVEIISGSSVKVIEYARVATSKSSPNIQRYIMMGGMLGFVLSCGVIMLLSLIQNGLTTEEKIHRDFKDKAVLSVIPQMGDASNKKNKKKSNPDENAELCGKLSFAPAEAYKLLRANITFCFSDDKACRVIGVTSSVRSEGKTTTSINLAYTLAQTNQRVCLVDCDFRLPSVSKTLEIRQKPGMTNFLVGQANGKEVLQKYTSGSTRLYVIASGDIPPNPSELLASDRMQTVIRMLEETFDYVILDLPPIGIVSDALGVTKYTDGLLFVVREDMYDKKMMNESMRTLNGVDARILGMVVTHSSTQQKEYRRYGGKYGSKYGYQYGYQYGYGSEAAAGSVVAGQGSKRRSDNQKPAAGRTVEPDNGARLGNQTETEAGKAAKPTVTGHGAAGQETNRHIPGQEDGSQTVEARKEPAEEMDG